MLHKMSRWKDYIEEFLNDEQKTIYKPINNKGWM